MKYSVCIWRFLLIGGLITTLYSCSKPVDAPMEMEMVWIPGGTFVMGTNDPTAQANERPAREVTMDGFWMDATPVTNHQFLQFVEATGYVTDAEKKLDWEEMKKQLPPGSPRPPESNLAPVPLSYGI